MATEGRLKSRIPMFLLLLLQHSSVTKNIKPNKRNSCRQGVREEADHGWKWNLFFTNVVQQGTEITKAKAKINSRAAWKATTMVLNTASRRGK